MGHQRDHRSIFEVKKGLFTVFSCNLFRGFKAIYETLSLKNVFIIIFNICVINDFFTFISMMDSSATASTFLKQNWFDHVAKTLLFDKVIFLFVENKNILILCFHKNAALKKALLHSSS